MNEQEQQEYIDKVLGKTAFYYFQTFGMPPEMFTEEVEKQKFNSLQLLFFCKVCEQKYLKNDRPI